MLFNSLQFAFFFPLVIGGTFLAPPRLRWVVLLLGSYWFYMTWAWWYGPLLLALSTVDWYAGIRIHDARTPAARRAWLAVTLAGNLGLLFVFKYLKLFEHTLESLGVAHLPELELLVPVGISFHTFQTIGYAIDVYRGKLEPERRLGMFALFVSFFPQLMMGPIERATRLLPQLQRPASFDAARLSSGLRWMAWGLFKKVVVADRLSVLVHAVYGDVESYGGFGLVLATFFFAWQVYCDFSGYSDMAVGAARVLGVDLMRNFDAPYGSRSMTEMWTRWHISLSTWFRDYLYVPLGGSRVSFGRWALNVMVVFVVSGVWHGAEWRFALWGALNGIALVLDRATQPVRDAVVRTLRIRPSVREPVSIALTFALWLVTLVPFRAESTADVAYVYRHALDGWSHIGESVALALFLQRVHIDLPTFLFSLALVPLIATIDAVLRRPALVARFEALGAGPRWAADYALVFSVLALGHWSDTPFVYFQF